MSRNLSALNAAELAKVYKHPALFVELECRTGFVRLWSGVGTKTALTRDFQGVGALGGISGLPETGELSPMKVTMTLTGINETIAALSLDRTEYRNRPVRIWRGFFDADFADLVAAAQLRWAGRMQVMSARFNGPQSSITLSCESRLMDLRRPRLIRLTHDAQQARFSGDRGLEYISTVAQAPIYWGGPGPSNPGGYGK